MAARTPAGQVERQGDAVLLVFDRTLPAPVPQVWHALTDPHELARWFGRWSGDPSTGEVELVMADEGAPQGERVLIDACEPPTRLAVTLPGPEGAWPLSLALADDAGTTRLRFVHRLAEPVDASSIGPGWHYYLDRLSAVVTGAPLPEDFDEYLPGLAAAYDVPTLRT